MRAQFQSVWERLAPAANRWLGVVILGIAYTIQRLARWVWRVVVWVQEAQFPLSASQAIILFFALFATAYAFATPPYEAAYEHQQVALIINQQNSGAVADDVGYPPPLYYTLANAIAAPTGLNMAGEVGVMNPYVQVGAPNAFGNKNLLVWPQDVSPFNDQTTAILVLRFLNIAFSVASLALIGAVARILYPQRPVVALLAMALTAFNPMFLFMSASVGYLSLALLLSSVVIYGALKLLRDGFSPIWISIPLLAFALSGLTYSGALALAPMLLLAGLWVARREKQAAGLMLWLVGMGAAFAVILWGNAGSIQTYSDPMAWFVGQLFPRAQAEPIVAGGFWQAFQMFRVSYWGLFGLSNIAMDFSFYALMDILTLLSVVGLALHILQLVAIRDFSFARYELAYMLHLVLVVVAVGGLAVAGMLRIASFEGWFLFPYLAVFSPLLAIGLVEFIWWLVFFIRPMDDLQVTDLEVVPRKTLFNAVLWPARFLGLVAALIPFLTLAPQYRPPSALADLPQSATPVNMTYDNITLVGYESDDRRYQPDTAIPITLYWRVEGPTEANLSLSLTLKDPFDGVIGALITYPGAGRLLTSEWEAGAIYPDYYEIAIYPTASGRYPIRLQVDWLGADGALIPPQISAEPSQTSALLPVGALVSNRPALSLNERSVLESPVDFGGAISLLDFVYRDGQLSLLWETITGAPTKDYIAFAWVEDVNGRVLAQSDVAPLLPTRYWRWGERFITEHTLSFNEPYDPFRFTIHVGWRDAEEERLDLGDLYPNDAFPLPPITFPTSEATPEATAEQN